MENTNPSQDPKDQRAGDNIPKPGEIPTPSSFEVLHPSSFDLPQDEQSWVKHGLTVKVIAVSLAVLLAVGGYLYISHRKAVKPVDSDIVQVNHASHKAPHAIHKQVPGKKTADASLSKSKKSSKTSAAQKKTSSKKSQRKSRLSK